MLQLFPDTCKILLLRGLPEDDLSALATNFERVDYARGDVLIQANQPIDNVVFPESGIFSIVLKSACDPACKFDPLGRGIGVQN